MEFKHRGKKHQIFNSNIFFRSFVNLEMAKKKFYFRYYYVFRFENYVNFFVWKEKRSEFVFFYYKNGSFFRFIFRLNVCYSKKLFTAGSCRCEAFDFATMKYRSPFLNLKGLKTGTQIYWISWVIYSNNFPFTSLWCGTKIHESS